MDAEPDSVSAGSAEVVTVAREMFCRGAMISSLVPEIVTVSPRARSFSLAYASSTTVTSASVSALLNVRPLLVFEEVSGPMTRWGTSVTQTV